MMKELTYLKWPVVCLLVSMLIGTFFIQRSIASPFQYIELAYGLVTFFFLYLKRERIGTSLFSLILFTIFLLGIMWFVNFLIHAITTEPHVLIKGEVHRVMDLRWLWGMGIGLLTGLAAVYIYYKKKLFDCRFELWITFLFIIAIGCSILF